MTITQSRLPANYTASRPIQSITNNALGELAPSELTWISREWFNFRSENPDDEPYNVIMEVTTPETQTRAWVIDRNSPEYDNGAMIILPMDY